jgi:hypothetical protein
MNKKYLFLLSVFLTLLFFSPSAARAKAVMGYVTMANTITVLDDLESDGSINYLTHLIGPAVTWTSTNDPTLIAQYGVSASVLDKDINAVVKAAHDNGLKAMVYLYGTTPELATLISNGRLDTLAANIETLVVNYNLDGITLDVEVPNTPDQTSMAQLIDAVYARLHPRGKILDTIGMAGKGSPDITVAESAKIDYIEVMCYDMFQKYQHATYDDTVTVMNKWLNWGFSPSKLVLGTPFYGYDSDKTEVNYSTIVDTLNPSANQDTGTINGKAVWWSGIDTTKQKAEWVLTENLGGIMVFAVNYDKFNDSRSLLKAIYGVISEGGDGGGERNSECYGAESNPTGNPIGGGAGYNNIIDKSSAKYVVSTKAQLVSALGSAVSGDIIYVDDAAEIDLGTDYGFKVPAGVTLASGRGRNGSLGGLIYYNINTVDATPVLFYAGNNSVFSGIRLRGPYGGIDTNVSMANGITCTTHNNDCHRIIVENCEIYNFPYAAISFRDDLLGITTFTSLDPSVVSWVHHNYIHNNQRTGYGYGVAIYASTILIEGNLFQYNRHHVAGGRTYAGNPTTNYEVRYNIMKDTNANTHVDCHGGNDNTSDAPMDPTADAGGTLLIHHNTMAYAQTAVGIRGYPRYAAKVYNNWAYWTSASTNVFCQYLFNLPGHEQAQWTCSPTYINMSVYNNWQGASPPPACTGGCTPTVSCSVLGCGKTDSCGTYCGACAAECGNGVIEGKEVCEIGDTSPCTTAGYTGIKYCIECASWSSTCYQSNKCGDGEITNPPEVCETGDKKDCVDLSGYKGSSTCSSDCKSWQDCVATEKCGDYIINGNSGLEECDKGYSNGQKCSAPYGGTCQYCDENCKNATQQGAYCGDGNCDSGECAADCASDCSVRNCCGKEDCNKGAIGENETNCSQDCAIEGGTYKTYSALVNGVFTQVAYQGFVPCGKKVVVNAVLGADGQVTSGEPETVNCQFCHFFIMAKEVFSFLIKLMTSVAVVFVIIGGYMFLFARGNPEMIRRGRTILISVAIGIVVVSVSWLLINTILMFLGVAKWTGLQEGWFKIVCSLNI